MNNLVKNWKTSSAGIVLILTGLIHIGYGLVHKSITEQDFTTTMVTIVTGLGLMVAGDASASAESHAQSQTQIAELQLRSNIVPNAIESGDTSQLRKVPITPAPIPPTVPPEVVAVATPVKSP